MDILRLDGVGSLTLGGVRLTVTPLALRETTERLFPASRHRSKRLHKKLLRRFGGEFRKVPCAFDTPAGLVMHPEMYAAMKAAAERKVDEQIL